MPFTISHTATALPFIRTRLVFSAVIVGTMAPDFEYIASMGFYRLGAHSLLGILLFCIPAGLLSLYLYHCLWKDFLIDLCPDPLRRRLIAANQQKFRFFPATRFINIIASISLGSVLHILWDAVTHDSGFSVKLFPWLLAPVPGLPSFQWWAFLHGLGSILGLAVTGIALIVWYKNTTPVKTSPLRVRPSLLNLTYAVATGLILCTIYAFMHKVNPHYGPYRYIALFVLGGMIYTTATLTIYGITRKIQASRTTIAPE